MENKDLNQELCTAAAALADEFIAQQAASTSMPKGAVVMWTGVTAPEGWALCDGTNSTPDLRGRFVVGYDLCKAISPAVATNKELNYGKIGNRGGEDSHVLKIEENARHKHFVMADDGIGNQDIFPTSQTQVGKRREVSGNVSYRAAGVTIPATVGLSSESGGSIAHENRPPYYVLAYIMKL